MSIVKTASAGNAFDVNSPLSTSQARAFSNSGYGCVIRYIPRTSVLKDGNLTAAEIQAILQGGLEIMVVQHVSPDNWLPNAGLGHSYGSYAVEYCTEIGLPKGITVWLDLEMASKEANPENIIAYCRNWFANLSGAGYVPGLYVGYQSGLTDAQLYALPVTHYWRGYNCDQNVPIRGYQVHQTTQKTFEGITFDPDVIAPDALGDLPFVLSS